MSDEAMEGSYAEVMDSDGDSWPAQTYSSILNHLDLAEDTHHGSTNSTPVNSTTVTA